MEIPSSDSGVVYIARCPEHGLHGCRAHCFECGVEAEQVPFVTADEFNDVGAECSRLEADILDIADAINEGLACDERIAINASSIVEWVEQAHERLRRVPSTQQNGGDDGRA